VSKPFRVGIIGVSLDHGWASIAHIPALRSLPERFQLTAVGTRSQESARNAAVAAGVAIAFDNPAELAAHPDVYLVLPL
jgi:predicted dehydrogenase